jgi:N6-adenosine-specific RNA methylase IME4
MTRYGAILADPPWRFATYSDKGRDRSADKHYSVMTLEEIQALPVATLAADDAALFLWVSNPMLPQGLQTMAAWGFSFKAVAFTWAKRTRLGVKWHLGLGFWTRANPEQCLLGTRGKPKRLNADVRALIDEPVREHSRKPDRVRTDIQRLVGGPYVELFARSRAERWDVMYSDEPEKYA